MLEEGSSYEDVLFEFLGDELKSKKKDKLPYIQYDEDMLERYLHDNVGRAYYGKEKDEMRDFIIRQLGLKGRKLHKDTINGNLKDHGILYEIVPERQNSGKSGKRNRRFWTIQPIPIEAKQYKGPVS